MEAIVTSIQGLSGSESDLGSLLTYLKSAPTVSTLQGNVDAIIQAVHSLDATQHSLGMLILL
jgi:hypothetical protein